VKAQYDSEVIKQTRDVVPYVPGASDPVAEEPWDWPDAHRVEFHVTTTADVRGTRRPASGQRPRGIAKRRKTRRISSILGH
jgi:hypothetical protein